MSGTDWILLLGGTAVLAGVALLVYRRREAPGRGRTLLAALRAVALGLVVLLLLDPQWSTGAGREPAVAVLLDASLSMLWAAEDEATPWQRGVAEAAAAAGDGPVLLFGGQVRPVPAHELGELSPVAPTTRLLPALKAAAELGARRALVVTDRGVEDALEVARWLPRLGLELEVRSVAGAGRGAVVAEVAAPAWAEAGEAIDLSFGVAAPSTGPVGDSLTVTVRAGSEPVGSATVAAPERGRMATGAVRLTPPVPPGGGHVRLDVALEQGRGGAAGSRHVYVHVGPRPAGVVIVSLLPDQEPRFLQPALAQALGVPVVLYLRVAPGRWVRGGAGEDVAGAIDEALVRGALAEARIAVLHGASADAPEWLRDLAAAQRRLMAFPAAAGPVPGTPVVVGQAVAADWYLAEEVPASPVAPHLVGLETAGVPPLTALRRPAGVPDVAWSPLNVRRGAQGTLAPLAVAGETDGRRWVVPLGDGYWRWAFRGGQARPAYRRLWAALTGWLARDAAVAGGEAVSPVRRSVPRGEEVVWSAPGQAGDTLRLALMDAQGAAVLDTTLVVGADGSAATPALPPGHYTYRAGLAGDQSAGPLSVEPFAAEWVRPAVPLEDFAPAGAALGEGRQGAASGRPIRNSPWPWLAVVALLTTEWMLRRRWGLR